MAVFVIKYLCWKIAFYVTKYFHNYHLPLNNLYKSTGKFINSSSSWVQPALSNREAPQTRLLTGDRHHSHRLADCPALARMLGARLPQTKTEILC